MPSDSLGELTHMIEARQDYRNNRLFDAYVKEMLRPLFQRALDDVLPDIKRRHEVLGSASNEKAKGVHYTTIGVLMQLLQHHGAAEAGTLRLYDSTHLNDPDEGNYLPRRVAAEPGFEWLDRRGHVPLGQVETGSHVDEIAYLTSFVAGESRADNLVFWRTYGQEGKGCSIVCSLKAGSLKRVLYGDEVTETLKLLRPILAAVEPLVAEEDWIRDVLAATLWSSLRSVLYLYKSPGYDYEEEFRYILLSSQIDPDDICYEYQDTPTGMPRIRHYVERDELSINEVVLSGSRITIGPCVPQPDHVRQRLSRMVGRVLKGQPEIRRSAIPYRQT